MSFLGYSTQKLTNSAVTAKRNELFEKEKERQLSLLTRIEKIQVEHRGPPDDCTLLMNKSLSTPFNCAMRKFNNSQSSQVTLDISRSPTDLSVGLLEIDRVTLTGMQSKLSLINSNLLEFQFCSCP